MNARFVNAAETCGAPRADVAGAHRALSSARALADRSLRFQLFTADEVYRIVMTRLPPKPSKDVYGISVKLLRSAILPLAPVLAHAYNVCIINGSYPSPIKISKVSPLFKGKGRRSSMDGYRPVSIIPAVAKVFENGLCARLIAFLASTNALSDRQYAYREGRSTTSLTRELISRVVAAREKKQQVAVICCDLSKAFDVADHDILAVKLKYYGVDGRAYSLLNDLLTDRSQVVLGSGGKAVSDPLKSKMGVAQGSSVSNILFSLLLNDLPEFVTTAETYMYADDVAAIVSAPTIDLLEKKLNDTASRLAEWFSLNGLALNLSKTHFIHFCLSGRAPRPLTVLVNRSTIDQVQSTTFLGFQVDRGLQWASHIDRLCGKLGSACYALSRVARVVSVDVVRACYFATIQSILQYGTELWARAADWERAFRMQKRAIRAIVRIRGDVSARPHFKVLGILTLPCLLIYQVAMYVRTNLDSYIKHSDVHPYHTRNRHNLAPVSRTLTKSSKLTHVMGPIVYNKLPNTVTEAASMPIFKEFLLS